MNRPRGPRRSLAAFAPLAPLAALATAAVGCMTGSDVLVERPWSLVTIAGQPPAAAGGVTFGTDGRFTVDTGCNSGGGTYHLQGNRISLDSEVLTQVACVGAVGEQERAVLGVIEGTPAYAIDTETGRLRLTGPGDVVLLLEVP